METPPGNVVGPRKLTIANDHFSYANVEAWLNIIRSYMALHPRHEVIIHYEGETIQNNLNLFKLERPINEDGFEMTVHVNDGDETHVTKLFRLLVEGGGPNHNQFIRKELHQILDLF